jgi:methionyl-tRNA formyltransferase
MRPTRVVFLGTPEFAVPSLEALIAHPDLEVCGVVTQPDRPAGRGQHVTKSAVKLVAEHVGIPVFQPETLRDPAAIESLQAWSPDVMVVAAFGQILRKTVLEMPAFGCINVHASLLPRWRGAAPIQYAIRAGDTVTGITIMKMDVGLDTGPMLSSRIVPIAPDETASTLHDKLASAAADFLPGVLLGYLKGEISPQPQPEEGVTLAPTLKKPEGQIDWSQPAEVIDRHVRAFTPWPGTYTLLNGDLVRIIKGSPLSGKLGSSIFGSVALQAGRLVVQTGDGLYAIDEIQPAGKQKMAGISFANGRRDLDGAVFSKSE